MKGEELLTSWSPRKVSLVRDFIASRRRRQRIAELEAARGALGADNLLPSPSKGSGRSTPMRNQELSERQNKLVQKYLGLWSTRKDPTEAILVKTNTEQPINGAAPSKAPSTLDSDTSSENGSSPRYVASVQNLTKNATVAKSTIECHLII